MIIMQDRTKLIKKQRLTFFAKVILMEFWTFFILYWRVFFQFVEEWNEDGKSSNATVIQMYMNNVGHIDGSWRRRHLPVQLILCLAIPYVVTSISVKLGMLSPFRHPRLGWENNAAAATIAVERAQGKGLLVGHNIRFVVDLCHFVFSTQYRIVPKSESGRLWQLFLPMRQISATKRTTCHDPCSFPFSTGWNKITIECRIIGRLCYFLLWYSRDLNLDKQKYVWEIKLTRIIPKNHKILHLSYTRQEGLSSAHWTITK